MYIGLKELSNDDILIFHFLQLYTVRKNPTFQEHRC